MPRKSRLNVPGTVAHVMDRNLPGESLFQEDPDRIEFLSILSDNLIRTGHQCYAWTLMSNHYHLVVRISDRQLWELMKEINTAYIMYLFKDYALRNQK